MKILMEQHVILEVRIARKLAMALQAGPFTIRRGQNG
jgi:hypothetical protein